MDRDARFAFAKPFCSNVCTGWSSCVPAIGMPGNACTSRQRERTRILWRTWPQWSGQIRQSLQNMWRISVKRAKPSISFFWRVGRTKTCKITHRSHRTVSDFFLPAVCIFCSANQGALAVAGARQELFGISLGFPNFGLQATWTKVR